MSSKRQQAVHPSGNRHSQTHPNTLKNNFFDVPLVPIENGKQKLIQKNSTTAQEKSSTMTCNGYTCQLIPVEIEKDAELGLVVGRIDGENWVFIDEILPNGMIETHGGLKEGDYLIQAGNYSLDGVDVPTALTLIEKAYDEGRKSISLVAARQQKSDGKTGTKDKSSRSKSPVLTEAPKETRARSFVEYENQEEEPPPPPPSGVKKTRPKRKDDEQTKF